MGGAVSYPDKLANEIAEGEVWDEDEKEKEMEVDRSALRAAALWAESLLEEKEREGEEISQYPRLSTHYLILTITFPSQSLKRVQRFKLYLLIYVDTGEEEGR